MGLFLLFYEALGDLSCLTGKQSFFFLHFSDHIFCGSSANLNLSPGTHFPISPKERDSVGPFTCASDVSTVISNQHHPAYTADMSPAAKSSKSSQVSVTCILPSERGYRSTETGLKLGRSFSQKQDPLHPAVMTWSFPSQQLIFF